MGDHKETLTLLADLRKRKTQKEVAALLGVDTKTVSRWEHGKVQPSAIASIAIKDVAAKELKT